MNESVPIPAVFIMVNPQVPANVGFVCRSLKNMGFHELRIVGNRESLQEAHVTAYQAHDVLEHIQYFDDLTAASEGLDLLIGTTAKSRKNRDQLIPCNEIGAFINERHAYISSVGLVFGSESNGLSHEDERACHVLSTIPMKTTYPSINLSHSVMIYAYELSKTTWTSQQAQPTDKQISFDVFDQQIKQLLQGKELNIRQPELYQRTLDALRLVPTSSIPLIMSLLRYFRR